MNSTQLADYAQRQHAWQAAIDAAEKHVTIGLGLQGQGGKILQTVSTDDAEQASKLIREATGTIEKGVKIERDARDKLIDLYNKEPRK